MSWLPTVVGLLVAVLTVLCSIGTVYYLRRKDRRETHEQSNTDVALALKYKDDLIESLQEERAERNRQLQLANERNERYEREVGELRQQLRDFEAESRRTMLKLLELFAESDRCLVPDCLTRVVPGDRRDPDTTVRDVSAG